MIGAETVCKRSVHYLVALLLHQGCYCFWCGRAKVVLGSWFHLHVPPRMEEGNGLHATVYRTIARSHDSLAVTINVPPVLAIEKNVEYGGPPFGS